MAYINDINGEIISFLAIPITKAKAFKNNFAKKSITIFLNSYTYLFSFWSDELY